MGHIIAPEGLLLGGRNPIGLDVRTFSLQIDAYRNPYEDCTEKTKSSPYVVLRQSVVVNPG